MEIQVIEYQTHLKAIQSVRIPVFVEGQGVPLENEMDDRDKHCLHVLIMDQGHAIATGRLDYEQKGRIGRVAVLATERGKGIGKIVMETLEKEALKQGLTETWLHAQVAVIPFYHKLGYQEEDSIFMEENIPHQTMRKKL